MWLFSSSDVPLYLFFTRKRHLGGVMGTLLCPLILNFRFKGCWRESGLVEALRKLTSIEAALRPPARLIPSIPVGMTHEGYSWCRRYLFIPAQSTPQSVRLERGEEEEGGEQNGRREKNSESKRICGWETPHVKLKIPLFLPFMYRRFPFAQFRCRFNWNSPLFKGLSVGIQVSTIPGFTDPLFLASTIEPHKTN